MLSSALRIFPDCGLKKWHSSKTRRPTSANAVEANESIARQRSGVMTSISLSCVSDSISKSKSLETTEPTISFGNIYCKSPVNCSTSACVGARNTTFFLPATTPRHLQRRHGGLARAGRQNDNRRPAGLIKSRGDRLAVIGPDKRSVVGSVPEPCLPKLMHPRLLAASL